MTIGITHPLNFSATTTAGLSFRCRPIAGIGWEQRATPAMER